MSDIIFYDKIKDILFIKLFANYFNKNIEITKLIEILLNLNIIGDFFPNKKIQSMILIILLIRKDIQCLKYVLSIIIIKKLIDKNKLYFDTYEKSKYYKTQKIKLNLINFYKKSDILVNYINSFKLKLNKKELFTLRTKMYKLESDFLCESDTIKSNTCDTNINILKETLKMEIINRLKLLVSNISLKLISLNSPQLKYPIRILTENELLCLEFNEVHDYYEYILKMIFEKIEQIKKESKIVNNLKSINNIFISNKIDIIKDIKEITKIAKKNDVKFV